MLDTQGRPRRAQHRRPAPAGRARTGVLTAAAAAAVALSSGAGSGSAQADTATSLAKAQKQVDGLREQAAAAGEQYNGALAERHRMQRQVNFAQNDVAAQQEAVNKQVEGMGAIAAAQYRDGGLDQTVGMLTAKDPTDYLDRASSVRQVDRAQAGMLSQLQGKQQSLTRARDEAATALAAQQQQTQRMADARRTAQQKLAQAQQVLQKLTAQQREELARKAAEERAAQLAAAQQAARQEAAQQTAAQQAANSGSGGSSSSASGSVGEQALAAAKTKIGSPYVWAAAGPSSFDCSGLVQWAYAQVGISLPHYSYTDETVGSAVNGLANAEPGDIVVMLDGEHVGMYAGKNSSGQYMILHAPYPGAYVRLESIDTIGSVTAVRRM